MFQNTKYSSLICLTGCSKIESENLLEQKLVLNKFREI